MTNESSSYRESHAGKDYGSIYQKTYREGYYYTQWVKLEKPILEELFQRFSEKGAKKYLDFACGTGRILSLGEQYFNETVGVDVSDTMLDYAKKACKKSRIVNKDITKEKFPFGKFDVITAFRFFLNADSTLREEVLDSLYSMLSDDGVLITNIHVNSKSILGYAYRIRNRWLRREKANVLGYEELSSILVERGYEIQMTKYYSYFPRIGWYFPPLIERLFMPVEKICSNIPLIPYSIAQSFIVVCKKKTKW